MHVKFKYIPFVVDGLKYLVGEIGTPTIILVVEIEVINFRVCEEEERMAPVDARGVHLKLRLYIHVSAF